MNKIKISIYISTVILAAICIALICSSPQSWSEKEPQKNEPLRNDSVVTSYAYAEPEENINDSELTQQSGVNYYNGRTETYYSSNVLYHYRTPEWILDNEGFYRTSEGYYVVAASDMEQGTIFEGSKGTCIVLDCGCDPGITDYYVAWV